jgi:hypothetical protein
MRCRATITLLVSLAGMAAAQEGPGRPFPSERLVSLTAGVGNSMGWFGMQGERYFLDERLSVFVGLGYTPRLDQGDPTGPTFGSASTRTMRSRSSARGSGSSGLASTGVSSTSRTSDGLHLTSRAMRCWVGPSGSPA